jgi:hypothetical protein
VDDHSSLHGERAEVHTKIVRNFAVIGHVKGRQISILANIERSDAIVQAERIGGINRRGSDAFGGRHAHLRAGERKNHGHADGRAGAWVEIGGQRDDGPGGDEFARRSVVREAEMEAAAGQQGADDVRLGERANVGPIDLFEMIGAGGVQLNCETRGPGVGELLGMNAWDESRGLSRGEDFAGL